jgi:hypothetical protein
MANSATRGWALGTIVLCGLIGAAGYMLMIKPKLDEVAELEESYEAAREYNDLLDTQILSAKATAKEVPEWRGILAALEIDMPPLANQPELHRMVVGGLEQRGLPVMAITYGAPMALTAPTPAEAPAAPTDPDAAAAATTDPTPAPDSGGDAAAGEDAAQQAQQTDAAFARLVGIPVSITTQGAPSSVMEWFKYLQSQDDRFLTVVGFQIGAAKDEEREGVPPVQPGDWSITINAMAFSLIDPDKSYPAEEPGVNPPYSSGSFTVPIESNTNPTN